MTETRQPDILKNLVIFIVCLALAGTVIALLWYFAAELPVQQASMLSLPANNNELAQTIADLK
ncbi:MAG: hypothetical protein WC601_12195 [Desulfotomaculaceae bacterium]|jgi:hypothetical protein